ncbi:MAG: hypothetical protein QCI00_05975, partial [Candidatus Thermoplasmatota archaeon]|nr:hypothetical protein [Candidatus Thermoplasmatota archaeon]
MGVDTVIKELEPTIKPDNLMDSIHEIISTDSQNENGKAIMFEDYPTRELQPSDYLFSIEPHIPKELISPENFAEIKNIAQQLTGNLTSFFGFESRLTSKNAKSDYLIAVSSSKGEREALLNIIKTGRLPNKFLNNQEWGNVGVFTEKWADPSSILFNNILGLWLEFDTSNMSYNSEIPNVFLQIRKTRIDTKEDQQKFKFITKQALPLLTGHSLPKKIEENLIKAVKKIPEGTSLIHVGVMLSRQINGIRIVINRIKPEQIMPYLQSIGWKDKNDELSKTINEISKYTSRLILHITVGDKIDSKIGIECSF